MIDFLSNPDWIRPQMDFLVLLQNIRIGSAITIDKLFLLITIFSSTASFASDNYIAYASDKKQVKNEKQQIWYYYSNKLPLRLKGCKSL